MGNQQNSYTPPKSYKYPICRKGQQGTVFFSHMNWVWCEVFQVICKKYWSLLLLCVAMALFVIGRGIRIKLVNLELWMPIYDMLLLESIVSNLWFRYLAVVLCIFCTLNFQCVIDLCDLVKWFWTMLNDCIKSPCIKQAGCSNEWINGEYCSFKIEIIVAEMLEIIQSWYADFERCQEIGETNLILLGLFMICIM